MLSDGTGGDEVELYHRLQSLDEVTEQGSEVAVGGDRFRDRKEGLVLHPRELAVKFCSGSSRISVEQRGPAGKGGETCGPLDTAGLGKAQQ